VELFGGGWRRNQKNNIKKGWKKRRKREKCQKQKGKKNSAQQKERSEQGRYTTEHACTGNVHPLKSLGKERNVNRRGQERRPGGSEDGCLGGKRGREGASLKTKKFRGEGWGGVQTAKWEMGGGTGKGGRE